MLRANPGQSENRLAGAPAVGHVGRRRDTTARTKQTWGRNALVAFPVISPRRRGRRRPTTVAFHLETAYFATTRTAASGWSTVWSRSSSVLPVEMRYSPSNACGTTIRPCVSVVKVP